MENKSMPMPNMSASSVKEEAVSLHVPEQKEPMVKLETIESKISNSIQLPDAPEGGIKVKAVRPGFYRQERRLKGDEFRVPSVKMLGEWMVCLDPLYEKKRLELLKAKKKNAEAGLKVENGELKDELSKLKEELKSLRGE